MSPEALRSALSARVQRGQPLCELRGDVLGDAIGSKLDLVRKFHLELQHVGEIDAAGTRSLQPSTSTRCSLMEIRRN